MENITTKRGKANFTTMNRWRILPQDGKANFTTMNRWRILPQEGKANFTTMNRWRKANFTTVAYMFLPEP